MTNEQSNSQTYIQEPWDYQKFIRCYNQIADEYGGYYFRENIAESEKLKAQYERLAEPTLHDYALSTYQLDQQY